MNFLVGLSLFGLSVLSSIFVKSTRAKKIEFMFRFGSSEGGGHKSAFVVADELITDVFTNLYSNCVKYTDDSIVLIETTIDKDASGHKDVRYELVRHHKS